MPLSTADAVRLATLQDRLDKVISGQAVSSVEANGVRRDYSKADVPELKSQIQQLQAVAASPRGRSRGFLRFRL